MFLTPRTIVPLIALALGCARTIPSSPGDLVDGRAAADAALRSALEVIRQQTGVPGMAAAVVGRGGLLASAAVGVRRSDEPAPLTVADRFQLGSDTKAMTGFLLARLVEKGVLRWDTTLADTFPEWASSMDPAWRDVQVVALLRHRSGAPALTGPADIGLLAPIDFDSPVTAQRLALARIVLHAPPAVLPGETFLYSNAGYVLAAVVVEKRTGRSWESLLGDEVFVPLGMASCGFGSPALGAERGEPFAHSVVGGPTGTYVPSEEDNPPILGPAGRVHCSLEDWGRFVRANMEPPEPPLVSAETLATMHEPLPMGPASIGTVTGYAIGWGVGESAWARGPLLSHSGSNGRNLAVVRLAPSRGLAFLVVVNAGDARARLAADEVLERLVESYGGATSRVR